QTHRRAGGEHRDQSVSPQVRVLRRGAGWAGQGDDRQQPGGEPWPTGRGVLRPTRYSREAGVLWRCALAFVEHQTPTGSETDDFSHTKSRTPCLRKIALKGAGNAGKALSTSIGSGFSTA